MQLHQLKRHHPHKRHKTVGRGGKRGTTSGRGTKGQRARSGHKIRPEIRDIIKRLPKLRGHRSILIPSLTVSVSLAHLANHFASGETISPTTLAAKRLVSAATLKRGTIKIIGNATLDKALTIDGCLVTPGVREIVEKADGKVMTIKKTHAK